MEKITAQDRLLAGACYLLVPALYMALTERRNQRLLASHAAQAFYVWAAIFVSWAVLRIPIFYFGINIAWTTPLFHLLALLALVWGAFSAVISKC